MIADLLLTIALSGAVCQVPVTPPPRLQAGSVAQMPILMLAGGEVFFEMALDVHGRVAGLTPLRTTGGLTEPVAAAVRGWRFRVSERRASTGPARGAKVFVGALFRPPTLVGPTLGSPPVTVGVPDSEVPFPVAVQTPPFPPMAFGPGVVLIELRVEPDGTVSDATVLESAPPFDGPAVDAARQWRFRPARIGGVAAATYAYVLFGFPLPVGE